MPPISSAPVPPVAPVQGSNKKKKLIISIAGGVMVLIALFLFIVTHSPSATPVDTHYEPATGQVEYLAFQLFTDIDSTLQKQNYPPIQGEVKKVVGDIVNAVGSVGDANHKLGFIVGPIALDMTDDRVRERIQDSFNVALETNTAVGFHIDDSMFWGRLTQLNTIENIEWLDWNKTPNTGRRLDWSLTPTRIAPQLCMNSSAVQAEIRKRAALIGQEVTKGIEALRAAGKEDLFIGVIAGWEMQMGRDFDTGKSLGYCALTNKGYSATNPPKDIDQARVDITKNFIDLWTKSLSDAGVPENKIYSHVAFMPQINFQADRSETTYQQAVNFAPPETAFGAHRYPGFSTYPGSWSLESVEKLLAANGNPPWISGEGTPLDPAQAEAGSLGNPMEPYLASFFNHGAVLVNIFGWGVGPKGNAFRQVAENASAIAAYKKFLGGEALSEVSTDVGSSSGSLQDKIHLIQSKGPSWADAHLDQQGELMKQSQLLDGYLKSSDLKNANATADTILKMLGL